MRSLKDLFSWRKRKPEASALEMAELGAALEWQEEEAERIKTQRAEMLADVKAALLPMLEDRAKADRVARLCHLAGHCLEARAAAGLFLNTTDKDIVDMAESILAEVEARVSPTAEPEAAP